MKTAQTLPETQSVDLRWGTKARDLLVVLPLFLWYAYVAVGILHVVTREVGNLSMAHPDWALVLSILSQSAVMLFTGTALSLLLLRLPPKNGAKGILPRAAAILGTFLSIAMALLLAPASVPPAALAVSTVLIFGGTIFAIYAILHLGKSFSLMAEARRLVTTGPYARIRHPLYVAEEIAIFGVAIQYFSAAAVAILICQIACQFYRMGREEDVLSDTFPEYSAYKAHTARLIPGVY
ncbi:MAG: isoprenylcysteine carboxylmethyltransferase family protein [Alphaproteobacteria bacterium]|nr:isoprenylcysteine carboxylmethyltransferase family protein [Alphaproteobacteria bacterium]